MGVEAYEDPTEVEKLLMGYCERKRKAGESKEVVSKKLGEFEQVSDRTGFGTTSRDGVLLF